MKTILRHFFTCVFSFLTFSASSQVLTDPSLVAYYAFEGNAKDDGLYKNNGTVFDTPRTVSGVKGCALFFDGVDDFIQIPHSQSFNSITNELTITGWVFPLSLYSNGFLAILTKGFTAGTLTPYAVGYNTSALHPYVRFAGNNEITFLDVPEAPNSLRLNQWNFIAWRFKNGLLEIFLNDTKMAQVSLNFTSLQQTNDALEIARDIPGTTEFFHGTLDEFSIYNRALSDAEIRTAYQLFRDPQTRTATVVNATICQGERFEGYTTSGTYRDIFRAKAGCDSVRILNLTVNSNKSFTESVTICIGESYQGYNMVGTYRDTFRTSTGCDSIRTLNLSVGSPIETNVMQFICTGDSLGKYTLPGVYQDTFVRQNGCDSIRILTLNVREVLIPNAFTPNGDGRNDAFEVISNNTDLFVKRYLIFNRWGEVVYEAKNFTANTPVFWWNGEQQGKAAASDVYVYIIEYECADRSVILKGDVTLLR